jgi:chitinase
MKSVMYFVGWGVYARDFHVADIPADQLNRINYAFANVVNGTCALGDAYADTDKFYPGDSWDAGALRGSFHQLQKLKAEHPHVRTLISVGGWTWSGGFSDAALTAASRTHFAQGCVAFMKQYGFDGIDIDWEYPVSGGMSGGRPEDKANYTLLLQSLRDELDRQGAADGQHYELTIAAPAGPSTLKNVDIAGVTKVVDWINLMTYDYHGGWDKVTGHNAPLAKSDSDTGPDRFYVDATVQSYLDAGAAPGKLVLGVPFYGHSWSGVGPANDGLFQPAAGAGTGTWEAGSLDYADIAENYAPRLTRLWDSKSKTPYLYDAAKREFISYDDGQSMELKGKYIRNHGLAGAMAWELSADTDDNALLDALNRGMG